MSTNIDFTAITNYLGQPLKTANGHSYWQCPYCRDNGKDNLIYTHKNSLFTCFADTEHNRQILREIKRGEKTTMPVIQQKTVAKPEPVKSSITFDYISQCALELNSCETSKAFLKKQRGFYGDTLRLGFGIDKQNKRWVLPAIDIQTGELFGAEYRTSYMMMPKDKRPANHNGLFKAEGTGSRLCLINHVGGAGYEINNGIITDIPPVNIDKTLIITEGFLDAYTLWQILWEEGQGQELCTEIATPSNGVGTIKNLLHTIPTGNYKKIIIWLDSDHAGDEARNAIEKLAKFDFSFKTVDCKCCKDINEWYLKHIRKEN